MKKILHRANERGHADHGWLNAHHSFSFANWYDPAKVHFGMLRVLNDDIVAPGGGFGMHPHNDMEIITIILDGALQHKDNMGNGSVIRPGDVQRMTAGTGVTHSESNSSREQAVHLLQIWILPNQEGLKPGYEQKLFTEAQKQGRLCLIASADGREDSVIVHQDASVYATVLGAGEKVVHELAANRHAWIQVARGVVTLNGERLEQGDGAAVSREAKLELAGLEAAEVLLFDLA